MKENETKTQNKAMAQEGTEKQEKKGVKILKTVINTVINVMIVIVLITSIIIAVMALTSKANGISTIFGHTIQTIQSDSMKGGSPDGYPEGDFGNGDLMIAKSTANDTDIEYGVGDIVTFTERDSEGNDVYVVHRIVDVVEKENGNCLYQTWGDNREMAEVPDQLDVSEYLIKGQFLSVYYTASYKGIIIRGAGAFLDYLRSQQGFFFVVLLPMILFFMYELVRVVINFSSYKKAKTEEDKQSAVKEAVADALANQNKGDSESAFEKMTPEQMEQFKKFLEQQKEQNNPEE